MDQRLLAYAEFHGRVQGVVELESEGLLSADLALLRIRDIVAELDLRIAAQRREGQQMAREAAERVQ